jgi:hypothetical protein
LNNDENGSVSRYILDMEFHEKVDGLNGLRFIWIIEKRLEVYGWKDLFGTSHGY